MRYTKEQVSRHVCTLLDEQGVDLSLPLQSGVTLASLELDSLDLAELLVGIETLYDVTFDRDDIFIRPEAELLNIIEEVFQHLSRLSVG